MAQRLDKCLVYARLVKHRAKAQELILRGTIRVNRRRVTKPSHAVDSKDVLTLTLAGHVKVVRVLAAAARRGNAASAALLYEVLEEPGAHGENAEILDAETLPLC